MTTTDEKLSAAIIEAGTRTYLIEQQYGGKIKIDIPEDWKITFGSLSPGSKSGQLALRIYESETKQRAIFTDVKSFRDLSIPVLREVKSATGNTVWTSSEDEEYHAETKKVTREWKEAE